MHPRFTLLVLLVLHVASALPAAGEAAAQQVPSPVSLEATVGFREGHGGTYVNRGGASFDLAMGYRLRETSSAALVGALALGAQAPVVSLDLCLILPDGGCAPDFPVFVSLGALLGVQRGTGRTASARVLAGPAYYHGFEGGGAVAVQGRVDLASPPWQRTAVVASLRQSVLPSFRGEAVRITSLGIGLRLQ